MKRPFMWTFLLLLSGLLVIKEIRWGVLSGGVLFLFILLTGFFFYIKHIKGCRKERHTYNPFHKRMLFVVAVALVGLLRGCLWNHTYQQQQEYVQQLAETGTKLRGTGEITAITETNYGYSLVLSRCKMAYSEDKFPIGKQEREETVAACGDMLLYISKSRSGQENFTDKYKIGDRICVEGVPSLFECARNEGNFDYGSYAYSLGRVCQFQKPKITLIRTAGQWDVGAAWLKEKIKTIYEASLQTEDAGIGYALLTGDKALLSEDDEELFYAVGVGHVLAVSGLHLTVIGMGVYEVLRRLTVSLKVRSLISVGITFLFAIFSGSAVSALRALYMMGVSFGGILSGRRNDFFSSLGFAGTVLLILRPWALYSVSFQYSFLAMAGIGCGQIFLRETFERIHPILQSLIISFGAWLFTLPVSAGTNYEVSFMGIVLNLVVIPMMSPILILFLVAAILGVLNPGWGIFAVTNRVIFFLLEKLLWALRSICALAEKLPCGSIITGKPSWLKCGIYLVLITIILLLAVKTRTEKEGIKKSNRKILVLLPVMMLWMCHNPYKPQGPELVMLDVGQGDGIYIYDGNEGHFFVDGGSSSESAVGEYRILPFLLSRQIQQMDAWFVSHCDKDHISGLLEVLESGYRVNKLLLYRGVAVDEELVGLLEAAERNGTKVLFLDRGDVVETKGIQFVCRNTGEDYGDKNDNSLILEVVFSRTETKVLLAGDVGTKVEDELTETWGLEEISILKAVHHGSKNSNGENILEEIRPDITMISSGENNRYGHPHADTIERLKAVGSAIYRTDQCGQITIKINKDGYEVHTYFEE